jgi:hypothetical protein
MTLFKKPGKKSVLVGPNEREQRPKHVEPLLQGLAKNVPTSEQVEKDAVHLVRAASILAAVAEVTKLKYPDKDRGSKKHKDWLRWAEDLGKNAGSLAEAAKAKDAKAINQAALKVNATCNSCHSVFRD